MKNSDFMALVFFIGLVVFAILAAVVSVIFALNIIEMAQQ